MTTPLNASPAAVPAGLRIGYINQDFLPEVGAGPARLLEMSRRWQSLGASVTVITGMPNRRIPGRGEGSIDPRYAGKWFLEEEWEGIRTLRSWVFTGNGRGFRNKLLNTASFMATGFVHALMRRQRFDVLIASSPPFPAHVTGVALARLRGIPLVLEIRDLWPDYLVEMGMLGNGVARRSLFGLERGLLARADHTVVVTESFRERVVGKGVARASTDVIPNGVDLDQYYAANEPAPIAEAMRANGEFIVGYLGTFGRGQDLASVVRAAARIGRNDPTVRFVLVGDGPDMPAVRAAIAETGATNVSIAPPVPRTATRALYNAFDVCLVPLAPLRIFHETVPSKMFEIMACERPLVASVLGEAAGIVEASGGGLLAEPGDDESLARVILEMRSLSDVARRQMGAKARAYVAANYSRIVLADRYLGILESLCRRGRPSGASATPA